MYTSSGRGARGFSLLEMIVAVAILALSLGALYQATAGATRNVRGDEQHAYAVELARSVLARYASIPVSGVAEGGETPGGFDWRVSSHPVAAGALQRGALHEIEVAVSWRDGTRTRSVVLHSIAAAQPPARAQ